jgi:hypothetical protein
VGKGQFQESGEQRNCRKSAVLPVLHKFHSHSTASNFPPSEVIQALKPAAMSRLARSAPIWFNTGAGQSPDYRNFKKFFDRNGLCLEARLDCAQVFAASLAGWFVARTHFPK